MATKTKKRGERERASDSRGMTSMCMREQKSVCVCVRVIVCMFVDV